MPQVTWLVLPPGAQGDLLSSAMVLLKDHLLIELALNLLLKMQTWAWRCDTVG